MTDKVRVTVADQAGAKTVTADLPTKAMISRLLPALVNKMQLPNASYGIQHKQSNKLLAPHDTLEGAGVKDGDTLRLVPDVIAGI